MLRSVFTPLRTLRRGPFACHTGSIGVTCSHAPAIGLDEPPLVRQQRHGQQRMARTFEAGKASMIHSANFKINRTEEVEGELREQGLSSVQIDAAFLKQKQNQEKAQSTLEAMISMELSKIDDIAK